MKGSFNNILIKGIKAVVPSKCVENSSYEKFIGKRRCRKQVRLTGVETRFLSDSVQTSADLAYVAGKKLLERLEWDPLEIDVMVFLTQNPLFVLPSTAFFLQKELGLSKKCMVFDVNLGCTGAVEGIQIVSALLQPISGSGKGLVLVADAVYDESSYGLSEDEVANSMLFGSAGSAVAIEKVNKKAETSYFSTYSDGNRYRAIMRKKNGDLAMDGVGIFEFGINDVTKNMNDFRNEFDLNEDDIDIYSFHQAQKLMLDSIEDICSLDSNKNLRSLTKFGNTNGSSVLLNLCANRANLLSKEANNIFMCGFGVGLAWSYMYANIDSRAVQPIEYTDYHMQ